jgi:hypothetical protein
MPSFFFVLQIKAASVIGSGQSALDCVVSSPKALKGRQSGLGLVRQGRLHF